MTSLLAAIGWGLFASGAVTHVWHHDRLRSLLAMHLNRERVPALVLTLVEVALAVALPTAWLTRSSALPAFATVALLFAVGFMIWIARLLFTGSDLPCACSFSEAPTSWWSFARSACVGLVALFALAERSVTTSMSTAVATLAVGWAIAGALFVLPEALSWPPASKALLARVDAHTTPGL